jgi:hypothetical protein
MHPSRLAWLGLLSTTAVLAAPHAAAQVQPLPAPQPPPPAVQPQPYPPPGYQPQPQPPQPGYQPAQPQPYPQPYQPQPQPQPYPQPYQPQPQPYPQPYQPQPQPQPYPPPGYQPQPQPYQPQPAQPAPAPAPASDRRTNTEMFFLYTTGLGYGIGTGVWVDALFKITDPGAAVIAPVALGAAAPVGVYFWDDLGGPLHKGVPSSVATGLLLGALEGGGIAGTQYVLSRSKEDDWSFRAQTTITFLTATGGGVGGYFFGEYARPDLHSLAFISSGSGWGLISGALFGIGISGRRWGDWATVSGMIGYNVGLLGTGAISLWRSPSYQTLKWMWVGYGAGTLAGALVFPFYLFSDSDPKRGFVAPALGGIAGAAVAGVLTSGMIDDELAPRTSKNFLSPLSLDLGSGPQPVNFGVSPLTGPINGVQGNPEQKGALINAMGQF